MVVCSNSPGKLAIMLLSLLYLHMRKENVPLLHLAQHANASFGLSLVFSKDVTRKSPNEAMLGLTPIC